MRKTTNILLIIVFVGLLDGLMYCGDPENFQEDTVKVEGHKCNWELCPYKGITPANWSCSVETYTESEEGTDAYYIDMLHLEYPTEEYEQLEDRLFNWGGEPVEQSWRPNFRIIKDTTDERGLTSLIYTHCDTDTFSLDYLNKLELDSLKQSFK